MPSRPSLRNSRDFRAVVSRGRRAGRRGLTVYALPRPEDNATTRTGLAVRIPRGAVARNRIRRRLRAALSRCEVQDGFDIVIKSDDSTVNRDFEDLVADLRGALDEALSPAGVPR